MLRSRILTTFLFLLAIRFLPAQVVDDFTDGNFTANPAWTGDVAEWEVLAGRLHLNAPPVGATSHLSTPSIAINNAVWEFNVELTANPSATNFVEVFLSSDQSNLEGTPTGYLVRMGNTTDEVSLYSCVGGVKTEIIDGLDSRLNLTNPIFRVRVTRDAVGNFSLFTDMTGTGGSFVLEGSVLNTSSSTSSHFGVLTTFTSTRNTWCYFDNISVTGQGDITPPVFTAATAISATVVQATFNEKVSVASGQSIANFLLNGTTNPISAQIQGPDSARVYLTFATPFAQCAAQTLNASNIADRSNNLMPAPTTQNFSYVPSGVSGFKSVVISEIMADPTTPSPVCLPAIEYLELYNRGTMAVDLQGWKISDGGTPVVITNTSFPLCPGEYVLLTTDTSVFSTPKKIDVVSFPSLNSAGDPLGLRNNTFTLIDSVNYAISWYQDAVKAVGGWSLELINLNDTCSGQSNWIASNATCGGTPGLQNNMYSTVVDTTTPRLLTVSVTGNNTLEICLTEAVDPSYATVVSNYIANNGLGNPASVTVLSPTCFALNFAGTINSGVLYTLSATGLQDCHGNNAPSSLDFIQTGPGYYKAIIINEIFFDHDSAATNMPPVEFVELYNRSNGIFDLGGWTWGVNASSVTLGNKLVFPGDYLVLCKLSDTAWFPGTNRLGLSTWPSLLNGGASVSLRDFNNTVIDSVAYNVSMYQNPAKANGGWSIELINPSDTCAMLGNWIASNDPDGGTPGLLNSVYSVVLDVTGPQITSISVTGGNTVELCFNETMSMASLSNPALFVANNGIGAATSATPSGQGGECVTLVFPGNFTTGVLYTLTATNVQDCKGNPSTLTANFLVSGPAPFKAVIFNEIYPDPDSAATNMPPVEFVEVYNRSTSIFDLGGWTFSDASTSVTIGNHILAPGAYAVICKTSDTTWFSGRPYATVSSMPNLNTTDDELGLRDNSGGLVDSVSYLDDWYQDPVKDDGGWTLELINPNDTCSLLGNWIASSDTNGGTPGLVNSVYSNVPDTIAPLIVGVTVAGANILELCFNETVDAGLMAGTSLYSVNNSIGAPSSAVVGGSYGECVALTFPNSFLLGTLYTLTISGFADCAGNIGSDTVDFLISGAAQPNDVVINEIFAHPDISATSMPPVEYVELYNRSTNIYNLAGWSFSDPSTSVTLGSHVLLPGGYVVLCKASHLPYFTGLPAIGMSTLPGLNDTGDQIGLRDNSNNLIDTVSYDIAWYQNPIKDDGGWSLELINPDNICGTLGNWIASNDPDGGTPGAQNSVYNLNPDTTGPGIVGITIISPFSVEVCFTESMNLGTISTPANFSVNNGLGGPITATPSGADGECVMLLFTSLIDTGTIYTLTMNGLADCVGNPAGILVDSFVQGGNANRYQIVINEIFADESPVVGTLPEAEYIEIYNAGSTVVDLKDWIITDRRDAGTLEAFTILPGQHVIVCSNSNVFDFQSFGPTVGVTGMPGLNNSGDSLELFDANGLLIDWVYYSDTWYQEEAKEDGGYSLERLDPTFTCLNSGNWHASMDPNGGTPGTQNSISATFNDSQGPALQSAYLISPTVLRLYFDELMQETPLLNPLNFTVDNGVGHPVQLNPLGLNPFGVDITLGAPLDTNRIYCVTVTSVRDCPGNIIGSSNVVCFGIPVLPDSGDVIINEILFNPYTGGADYVELYNNSDKIIDLSILQIGEIYEETDSIFNADEVTYFPRLLLPGGYVALTTDRQFQLDTYFPLYPENIFEMDSNPSFDDPEGKCVIFSDSGVVLDRLDYLDDWQFPNLDDKNGVSLERHNFNRPTQDSSNWHSAASSVRYGTPGYQNSQVLDGGDQTEVWLFPTSFSPDLDGNDDVLSINYHFETSGWNARVTILDNQGRQVTRLQENTLLSTEQGTFTWDGINAAGAKADVGVYIVLFEATQPVTGEKRYYKLGVVLAAILN